MLDFKDSISHFLDRLKSPFGGVFIFAWVISHWEFVYFLLYVESEIKTVQRIELFKLYFQGPWWERLLLDLFLPALYTLIAITVYHGFSMAAGVIIGFFKRHWEPWISNKLGTGAVVSKELYMDQKQLNLQLELEINEMEKKKNEFQTKYNLLQNEISTNDESYNMKIIQLEKDKENLSSQITNTYQRKNPIDSFFLANRFKELELNGFRRVKLDTFLEIMAGRNYNFYHPNENKEYYVEIFEIDSNGSYFVDTIEKFKIESIYINSSERELYFEKFNLFHKINYINKISYKNNIYRGIEIDVIDEKLYEIIYTPFILSDIKIIK